MAYSTIVYALPISSVHHLLPAEQCSPNLGMNHYSLDVYRCCLFRLKSCADPTFRSLHLHFSQNRLDRGSAK